MGPLRGHRENPSFDAARWSGGAGGVDVTITFAQPVTSMLVVPGKDNGTGGGPHFQDLSPVDFGDAEAPDLTTQVRGRDRGGALFYDRDSAIPQLAHVNDNGISDGRDLAFFVSPMAEQAARAFRCRTPGSGPGMSYACEIWGRGWVRTSS